MAKAIEYKLPAFSNMSLEQIADHFKAKLAGLGSENQTMKEVTLDGAAALLSGKFADKPLDVAKWIYNKSGRDAATDSSYSSQVSKLAKSLKIVSRWKSDGVTLLEVAFDMQPAYNNYQSLLSLVNEKTKDKDAKCPTKATVEKWQTEKANEKDEDKPVNNADVGEKIVTMLTDLAKRDPNKSLGAALKAMGAYMDAAGMTTAQMRVAKDKDTRKAGIAATLAAINAATATRN